MTVTATRTKVKYGNKYYRFISASSYKYKCTMCQGVCPAHVLARTAVSQWYYYGYRSCLKTGVFHTGLLCSVSLVLLWIS